MYRISRESLCDVDVDDDDADDVIPMPDALLRAP